MAVAVHNQKHVLSIDDGATDTTPRFELRLNEGRLYRAVIRTPRRKAELLTRLARLTHTAVVANDGGLISNLKAWENLVLPLAYHRNPSYEDLEDRAALIFRQVGYSPGAFGELCNGPPDRLSRLEQRAVAFVRAMLSEPELMVYDNLFEGLAREEVEVVLRFDSVFHRHYPFRTALYVDLDMPMLPDVHVPQAFHFS